MPVIKKSIRRPWQVVRKAQEGRQHANTKFYQSNEWRKLRALKLNEQPLCEECLRNEKLVKAQMVDHITPINKGGAPLDIDNLQCLCNRCHAIKSGKERFN